MAALVAAYGLLWAAGGNDILATRFHLSLNGVTETIRVAIFLVPVLTFFVTRRWCLGLQRADNERLEHGEPTGIIVRSPEGGYTEKHRPIAAERAVALRQRSRPPVLPPPHGRSARARGRLSQLMYADDQPVPDIDDDEALSLPAAREDRE